MSIVCSRLSFSFDPLGEPLLRDVELTLSAHRTGIVGRNGSGKSTLLKLFAGELSPTSGTITVDGRVARLRQDLLQRGDHTVARLLGIDDVLAALRRIEAGSVDQRDFDAVGDDWDVEARAVALIAQRVPSPALDGVLHRTADTLSGGELVQLAMAALELSGASVALLDEPTNNLDARSRQALYDAVSAWPGQLVVVSHDVDLLNLMEATVEIHDGTITLYGGNHDFYVAERDAMQAAARRAVRDAERELAAQRRERQHIETATARRSARGAKAARSKRAPGMAMGNWKNASQRSVAAAREQAREKVEQAQGKLETATEDVRDDDAIRIPVIDPGVARGRRLLTLGDGERDEVMTGQDRWALVGDNGVGKSTMIRRSLENAASSRIGLLDQRLELPAGTVFDAVAGANPSRVPHDTHELLARFLIRSDMVHRDVDTLSGGERFRVALARILLADPPPELIILDEPTNNLDLDSVDELVTALRRYRGALLVVSHDHHLLERLELDRVLELTSEGLR